MKIPIRYLLPVSALVLVLAACADTGVSPTPSVEPTNPATPSEAPSEAPPSESPEASPEPVGVLTVAEGAVADGPGVSIAEALAGDQSQPTLVNGTLFLDADGQVYLADSLVDPSVPEFGDLRLRVENYPTDGPTWDMDDAAITGLQEANGIRFYEDTQLFGTISQ
jgi:hypothetical protein